MHEHHDEDALGPVVDPVDPPADSAESICWRRNLLLLTERIPRREAGGIVCLEEFAEMHGRDDGALAETEPLPLHKPRRVLPLRTKLY